MSVHRVLFEDTFTIKSVDNTKFDRVSRIESKSQAFETTLTLDINTDIYPLVAEQMIKLIITDKPGEEINLISNYEYVMQGKVFKIDEKASKSTVFASFGGLLMALTGETRDVSDLTADSRVFLMIRKTGEILM